MSSREAFSCRILTPAHLFAEKKGLTQNALIRFVVVAAACVFFVPQLSSGQSLPVPEYFGVYAVVDGKLLKLDGREVHAEKLTVVRMGQRMGVGNVAQHQPAATPPKNIQVPELPADLKIIIFAQAGGAMSPLDIAKTLHLESLVFVRTLTIDVGWPSIKRSDLENGWDAGDAVELAGVAGGEHARELEFLTKPMPGQKDMVIAGLADKLKPGVYRLTLGQRESFMPAYMQGGMLFGVQPVSQGESGKCVDALITYATSAMSMSNTKYTSCTGVPAEPPLPSPNPRASAQEGDAESRRTSAAVCANEYIGCVSAGRNAMSSLDWQSAINDFQTAANLNPTSTEPWVLLGSIYERTGQGEELSKAWNKAIAMGGTISVGACLGRAPKSCERGRLSLSGSSISFSVKGNPVFSASPGEINSDTTPNGHEYSFQIAQIRYTFDFFPSRGTCAYNKAMVECPPEGTAQQLILARYVSQTMPRLSHAALAKEP